MRGVRSPHRRRLHSADFCEFFENWLDSSQIWAVTCRWRREDRSRMVRRGESPARPLDERPPFRDGGRFVL